MSPPLVPRNPADQFTLVAAFPPSEDRDARLFALATRPDFDPARARRRAVEWGLAPLVGRTLARHPAGERFDDDARAHLALIARLTAVRNGLLLHHLRALGRSFAASDLPFLVLKGADLMQTVYPDPGCRVSVDLDLLCNRGRIDEAEALLRDAGWTPALAASRDWFDRNLHHGLPWMSPDGAVTLELHWDLVRPGDPVALDLAGMTARALPFRAVGPTAARLAPRDLLDHLAAHMLRHLNTPDGAYRSLVDIAWVMATISATGGEAPAPATATRVPGPGAPLALALDWCTALLTGIEPAPTEDPVRTAGRKLLAGLPDLPVRQAPAVANGVIGLAERGGAGARVRFLRDGLLPKPGDAARDLSPEEARRPLPLRYLALFTNYAAETWRLGPRGLRAAWQLGRFRNVMATASRATPLLPEPEPELESPSGAEARPGPPPR